MWWLVIIKFQVVLISPNEKGKNHLHNRGPRKPRRTIIKGEFQIEIKFELLIRLQNEQHIETLLVFFVAVIIQCYSIL